MTVFRTVEDAPDRPAPPDLTGSDLTGSSVAPRAELGVLFDRYGRALLHYCARRVGPDHAEDVVAQTFLTAHATRHRFDPGRSEPLPWLYGIATNVLRRHRRDEIRAYRALARAGTSDVAPEDGAERAAERADAARVRQRLAGVLAELPRRQRDVLLLYAVAQLEYAEIAAALRIPLGSVRSALHRARTRVRAALRDIRGPSAGEDTE